MASMLIQPKGSTAIETNRQTIARILGIEISEVAYLATGLVIDTFKVLYDKTTQTCWYRGDASGTVISWVGSTDSMQITTEKGDFSLKLLDIFKNLKSTEPGMGVDLIGGSRRYFKVTDYPGGIPDSSVSRNGNGTLTIIKGTNNTSAIKAALADAQTYNGIVYFPSPKNGNAYLYDETLFPAVTSGSLWRGASLLGDGKTATKLIFDGGDIPAVHVKGTSGWPTNIFLQGMSLYSANDFVGEGWKLQGITGIRLSDFAAYRFGDGGLSFSNGSAAGIFTEFNIIEDGWLENNKTNIKFRKDGGDGSFHGITLRNVISNNLPGQTGLDVGAGCVIYNADWNQVTFFGAAGVQWILNNGSRNGFETLYFEGNGTVTNNGSWSTAGHWRIQNGTGAITDTSTIPFFNESYITPVTPSDPNFATAGFTAFESLKPLIDGQVYRGLMRLRGSNAEALAVTGYDSGTFEKQGLAIVSQSAGDSVKDLILRQLIHLNGITSFRPEYKFNYVGGATQLAINSSGRHTGIMGRRATGAITANASTQTISLSGLLPAINQAYDVIIDISTAGVTSKFTGVFCGFYDTTTNTTLKSIDNPRSAGSEISVGVSSAVKITSGGDLTITLTATANCTYSITIIGKGTY
ncbi:tail fiber protein [Klebsiella phage Muenster]|nr:tail fiber protein [Klebsiella phage Muenster]